MMTVASRIQPSSDEGSGDHLASGLNNLLEQIEPGFRKPLGRSTLAQHIAEAGVKHPAIVHAGTRAKAVSQSELIHVL
jgi:hypothetical protein